MTIIVWNADMERPPTVFVLVGPPGSGKTTWRNKYLEAAGRPVEVISSDDIIDEYALQSGIAYDEAFRRVDFRSIDAALNEKFEDAISRRADVVIDRTNMTEKSRNHWLRRIPAHYTVSAVVFEVSPSELYRRLKHREKESSKKIPENVVTRMLASYERPELEEGFSDIHVFTYVTWG